MTKPPVVGTLVGNPRPGSRTVGAGLPVSDAVHRALRARGHEVADDGPLPGASVPGRGLFLNEAALDGDPAGLLDVAGWFTAPVGVER